GHTPSPDLVCASVRVCPPTRRYLAYRSARSRPTSVHESGRSERRSSLFDVPIVMGEPLTEEIRVSTSLPPLVAPAAELTREEVARYSRHLIIPDLGVDGQKRLKNAKVLVIGAGGLGSPALLYLAAAGVGTIGIVEFDVVDESNLQRQIIHGQSDIGRSKAESARDSIKEINPLVDIRLHELRLEPDNAVDLFRQYDLILDGTDNFATRYLVNDAAVLAGKPY